MIGISLSSLCRDLSKRLKSKCHEAKDILLHESVLKHSYEEKKSITLDLGSNASS